MLMDSDHLDERERVAENIEWGVHIDAQKTDVNQVRKDTGA